MASGRTQPKKTYSDISKILDIILDGDGDSDADIDLGWSDYSDNSDPDWEYKSEPSIAVNDKQSSVLVSSEKSSSSSSTEPEEDACLADTADNEVGQYLMNKGISRLSIDSSIDKISHDNHNNIADNNDEVSVPSEMTQTGRESESDDVPLANKVLKIDATGNNTHVAVNRGQGGHGIRTCGGCRHGVRTCSSGQGAHGKGRGACGRGVQANQRRRHGNGCSGARLPLSIWRKVQSGENIALNDFGFAETEGVNMRMGPHATCSDFVDLYCTKEFWELLVTEANRFAVQFFENLELTSYTSEWVPVTIDEMKVFIGLVMLMSIIHKPSINLYWATDALYHMPTFSQVMNRN